MRPGPVIRMIVAYGLGSVGLACAHLPMHHERPDVHNVTAWYFAGPPEHLGRVFLLRIDARVTQDAGSLDCATTGLYELDDSGRDAVPQLVGDSACVWLGRGPGPDVSPDGREVALVEGGVLKVLDINKRTNVTIAGTCSHVEPDPAWSTDGGRLAFTGRCGTAESDAWLYAVGQDGKNLAVVASGLPGTFMSYPRWSPNGRDIAFTSWSGSAQGYITIVRTGEGHPRTIALGVRPEWDPAGQWIAYFRIDTLNLDPTGIALVRSDGSDDHEVLTFKGARTRIPPERAVGRLMWNEDGSRILFSDGRTLWSIGRDGLGLRRLLQPD